MSLLSLLSSWIPVVVWASLIFYLSGIPGLQSGWGVWDLILRKGAHLVEYAALTALLLRAVGRTWPPVKDGLLMLSCAAVSFLYAVSDEVHQAFVPRRGPAVGDVIIDAMGIILCLLIYRKWRHSRGTGYFV